MEEIKDIGSVGNEEYLKVVPRIAYYMKSKNIGDIFKYKSPLFAAIGEKERIYLFSNSLEHMGTFSGHENSILCLCGTSHKILASGSWDNNIKIWNIEERSLLSTLSQHTERVGALCYIEEGVLVSGSWDKSLIIWSKYEFPGSPSTYSHKQLTGHTSGICGIIRINNREIISGENSGHLRIWDIDQGVCIRLLPSLDRCGLMQMKQHICGEVAISYREKVIIWGAPPIKQFSISAGRSIEFLKQFSICAGCSIEFLDRDLLLRGGFDGQLEFIDCAQTGCSMLSPIQGLHSGQILDIQRIAKNIIITVANDGYIKVIGPLTRKCYIKLMVDNWSHSIAYFYQSLFDYIYIIINAC